MARPIDRVLERCDRPKRNRDGWLVRCPAHEDHAPSLSIREGDDGRALLHCFSGCTTAAIAAALGLTLADLFPPKTAPIRPSDPPRTLVATYDYADEHGTVLYQVRRYMDTGGRKSFRQFRPDGQGGWTPGLGDVRRVLYRLPALQGKPAAILVEGEKDADRLASEKLPATCNPMGGGKWTEDYTAQLKTAGVERVAILPDHDEPGERHALAVARSCFDAGLQVRVVRLPRLPPKGDVSDWLDAGHTVADLKDAMKDARPWTAEDRACADAGNGSSVDEKRARGVLTLTPLKDLLAESDEPVEWLVEDRIPLGGLALFGAKPKVGKTTALMNLSLAVARGEEWLGHACRQGPVWYLLFDRDPRSVVRERFRKLGGADDDPIRLYIDQAPPNVAEQLTTLALQERPAMIVIDTLQRFARVPDVNDYAALTTALDAIIHIARESGAALVLSHHNKKGEGNDIDSILGSTAIAGSVDTMLLLRRSDSHRLMKTIQRYGPELEESVVTLDDATCRIALGPSRRDFDRGRIEDELLAVLARTSSPLEEDALLAKVEGRTAAKREALRGLLARQRIRREGQGRKGSPFQYERLDPDAPAPESSDDSGILVPHYMRERANENPEIRNPANNDGPDSRSRDVALLALVETEQPDLGNENPEAVPTVTDDRSAGVEGADDDAEEL